MTRTSVAEIGAWGVSDQHIPIHIVRFPIHCGNNTSRSSNNIHCIAEDMPLRMPTGRLLNVAGLRLMSKRTERLADFLRFLAGNENFHRKCSIPLLFALAALRQFLAPPSVIWFMSTILARLS